MRSTVVTFIGPDTSTQTSPKIDANQIYAVSVVTTFGDMGATGTCKLQGSNDIINATTIAASNIVQDFTPVNWVDIPNTSATVTAGVCPAIEKFQLCYRWIRFVYTQGGSGSTTVTANINIQGF